MTSDSVVYENANYKTEYVTFNGCPGKIKYDKKSEKYNLECAVIDGDFKVSMTLSCQPEYLETAIDIMRNTTFEKPVAFSLSKDEDNGIYKKIISNDYIMIVTFTGDKKVFYSNSKFSDDKSYSERAEIIFKPAYYSEEMLGELETFGGSAFYKKKISGFGGVFKDSAMKLVKMPESYTDEEGNTCNYYEFYVSWDLNWGTLKDDEIIDFLSRLDVEIKDSLGNEKYRGATDINRVDY